MEVGSGLREGTGGRPRLDDDAGLRQGAHCRVALGEEVAVSTGILSGIPKRRNLWDQQMVVGDPILKRGVLDRIGQLDRPADDGNRTAAGFDRGPVRGAIDPGGETGNEGIALLDQ